MNNIEIGCIVAVVFVALVIWGTYALKKLEQGRKKEVAKPKDDKTDPKVFS